MDNNENNNEGTNERIMEESIEGRMEESTQNNPVDTSIISIEQVIPTSLFIVPIAETPIFPGFITPIVISSPELVDSINKLGDNVSFLGLLLLKKQDEKEVKTKNLYRVGTVVKIVKKIKLPNGGINLLINSLKRFKVREFISKEPAKIIAQVSYPEQEEEKVVERRTKKYEEEAMELKAYTRAILNQLRILSENNPILIEQIKLTLANIDEPSKIADFAVTILSLTREEYQEILEIFNIKQRLKEVLRFLDKEVKLAEMQKDIQEQINSEIDKKQREFFLREQLKAIKHELGMDEDIQSKEIKAMKKKMEELSFSEEVREHIEKEIEKLQSIDQHSSEYTVTKNYLDVILALPWGVFTKDSHNLKKAYAILNKDHYGLEDVKERIIEFLAVKKLKPESTGGSIICLVGPPGVGKTSLGKSIAQSLNRKFYRFSLGGMRDEAEIKGHRRTYVGAMPGKILQGLKYVKSANPVFMLDEIDKIGVSFQGDPASALLEVLDPEQNPNFVDHYLDLPFDLSTILFVTTANTLDTIPRPLLDRMEVIRLSGYIEEEKYEIAKRYLLPKQLEKHGLSKSAIKIPKTVYSFIINGYARDAGVRNIERNIEKIARKTASLMAQDKEYETAITKDIARDYLGPEIYTDEVLQKEKRSGVVTGLAWTAFGGSVLFIEAIAIKTGKRFTLTGQLGDVMSESASIAYSYVKQVVQEKYNIDSDFFEKHSIHLHVPAGATPKDGPSAGITMATSILSLILNKPVKPKTGMTGELTLTGYVLPIGGLKEKIIAAKRNKLKNIIFPKQNKRDLNEISDNVKRGLTFYPVAKMEEVIKLML